MAINLANEPVRAYTKDMQVRSKPVKLSQKQMGDISTKVDKQLKDRSGGLCERCRAAEAVQRAHIIGRKQLKHKTTVNDLLHVCVPCHKWLDETPEGIRYKQKLRERMNKR
jgi:hypothetical protein